MGTNLRSAVSVPRPEQTGTQSTPTLDTIAAIPMAAAAKTVLICDDDLGMRDTLAAILDATTVC